MFGYYILAIICFICIISIALLLGYCGPERELTTIDTISFIMLIVVMAIFELLSLKAIFQSEVKTHSNPKIEMRITTNISDGREKSDTLYIYKFKK